MISRTFWSQTPKPGHQLTGPLPLVVIHHSYLPDIPANASREQEIKALQDMDRYHRVDKGWAGLAYNFCVFQSGNVYECRGWLHVGGHTEGQNSKSHGICFVMDGSKHDPSPAAINAVRELLREGIRIGAVRDAYDVQPHDRYKNKVCPGEKIKAHLHELQLHEHTVRVLKPGMHGDDVRLLQVKLGVPNHTGTFGPVTERMVREFQAKHGLTADGIVGPATRAALGL